MVLPEHLSQYGYLFGGYLLKWVDEYAWIAATLDYPACNFVTVGLDKVEFKKSVRQGTILRFVVDRTKTGNTSVEYQVNVFRGNTDTEGNLIFSTCLTLVSIDQQGKKTPLPE